MLVRNGLALSHSHIVYYVLSEFGALEGGLGRAVTGVRGLLDLVFCRLFLVFLQGSSCGFCCSVAGQWLTFL
jgi:hypothetical protein